MFVPEMLQDLKINLTPENAVFKYFWAETIHSSATHQGIWSRRGRRGCDLHVCPVAAEVSASLLVPPRTGQKTQVFKVLTSFKDRDFPILV